MAKFVHTADWQLGKAARYLNSEARARFSAARLDVIDSIAELVVGEDCDFVVVCGDVFESNHIDRQVLVRALEKMRAAPQVAFYLLPGNHDPLDASSVFRSRTFVDNRPTNVTVLDGSTPVQAAPGVELIAAPWFDKSPLTDLVDAACRKLEPASTRALRILVGHGAVDAIHPEANDPALISLERLENSIGSGAIHYAALGDRHSTTDVGSTGRVWYSGAPEPTAHVETDPGNVLIVDVDRNHAHVERRRVGTWRFERKPWELSSNVDIAVLGDWLTALEGKDRTIVRLELSGQLSVARKARLDGVLAHNADLFAALDVRGESSSLVVIPDDADLDDFGLTGFAQQALSDLSELAGSEGERAAVAQDALALLYRFAGGNK